MLPEFVKDFEVVVVDDGSRDNTVEIVTRYSKNEPRVRLVRHEHNRGYGAAVTSGLRSARAAIWSCLRTPTDNSASSICPIS